MLIRRIELENFRQFKGKQAIEFSTNPDHPVTAILGQNTGGKTTLVRAIGWCLYGGSPEQLGFSKDSYFLNAEEELELLEAKRERRVRVTLILESKRFISFEDPIPHEFQYRITREKKYYAFENAQEAKIDGNSRDRLKIFERDLSQPESNEREIESYKEQKKVIDLIMPHDLSEYFFYWGESIDRIRKSKQLQKAIETFTGLSIYTAAKDDVQKVRNSYKKQANQSPIVDNELNRLEKEKKDLQQEADDYRQALKTAREKENHWIDAENQAQRDFFEVRNNETQAKRIKERRLEKSRLEKEKNEEQQNFIRSFSQPDACYAFVHRKAGKLLEELDKSEEKIDSIGWAHLTAAAIQEILDRGICVCGLSLSEHPEAIKHLEEEMRLALPNALGGYVENLRTTYHFGGKIANNYAKDLGELGSNIIKIEDEISGLQEELEYLALQENGVEEFNRRKVALETAQEEKAKASTEMSTQQALLERTLKKLDEKEEEIAVKEEERIRDEAIKLRHHFAGEILSHLKKISDEKVSLMRSDLEKNIQEFLNEMYHGHRTVRLTPTFQYRVTAQVNGKDQENDTSPGLETVLNFAFVAALLKLARQVRQKDKNDLERTEMSEPYPLVLDAPFSQTDEIHILNICKVITRVAEQTILIIMEKDWNIAQKALGNRVGFCYEIVKHSESVSTVRKIEK